MKSVLVQGATGSIGGSALDVIAEQQGHFRVAGLSASSRQAELLDIARHWKPDSLALRFPTNEADFRRDAKAMGVNHIYVGEDAAQQQSADENYDILLNALVGAAGIVSTLTALERGIPVALANKETLVAAGDLVMGTARERGVSVIPVDSEHSAIQQCLAGEPCDAIRRIWLTTSGGPFWGMRHSELHHVTPAQALRHPTWVMGAKITVDSATLFNKGLEVVEACKLFNLPAEKVKVIRQRESVIHSLVEFSDGSFKAQLSRPDMRLPILYALGMPKRLESDLVRSNPVEWSELHFDEVDVAEFPCLGIAYESLARGGCAPCAMSAADEIAVDAFLNGRIPFNAIPEVIKETMNQMVNRAAASLESILAADREARELAVVLCAEFAEVRN